MEISSRIQSAGKKTRQNHKKSLVRLSVILMIFNVFFSPPLLSKACPLNAWPVSGPERSSQAIWESFSQCFTPAVKEVVEFAKGIPGFQELSQHDQVMLLKSGTFQVRANI